MSAMKNKYRKRVVVIGGGTGSSVILRGLKKFTDNITAIVTVADDGGGSGVLREDLGMLPPGDIRSCILALADDESIMQQLLNYRFEEGILKGQSFGNLFIAAMNSINGNFMEAIKNVSDVMAIKGRVLPVTLESITLSAVLQDGQVIDGESHIPAVAIQRGTKIKAVEINPKNVKPLPEAIEAILNAQAVIIGPGSLYTSIIPDLLVHGIEEALQNTKAKRFYISNIMTQPGETEGYDIWDHIEAIEGHLTNPSKRIFDYIVINQGKAVEESIDKYKTGGSEHVRFNISKFKGREYKFIIGDYVEVVNDYIRHDAEKISEEILEKIT